MGIVSGDVHEPKSSLNESIDRATTGVFLSSWECFKQDLESLKLDWKWVEVQLKTMDKQNRDKFLAKAKEVTLRLKTIIGSK
jgi:hypothetical protein